jgi:superfamily II DNA or RNA helicase
MWHYLIIDEAHRVKNEKSQQSQALHQLKRFNCILLTGVSSERYEYHLTKQTFVICDCCFVISIDTVTKQYA